MANANRQNGGKNSAVKQNQLGLKEAYAILQRDFLELKKAFIRNEQELVEMQEQYLMLRQSYEELQRDSQDQKAELVKKLEKSYDAYNEKFMKVEELEEKLNQCNGNREGINRHTDERINVAFVQEQLIEVVRQKQVFEEAVQKSLANVGLSLLMVNGDFDLKVLDYKKLRRMVGFNNDPVAINSVGKSEKAGDLEEANALLQQTLLSLKYHSENQRNELSRKTELLQKKSEECLNLKTEIKKHGDRGTILVERKALGKILNGFSEMSDFVREVNKTVCDQNSWIEMLMAGLKEYAKSSRFKEDGAKTAVANAASHKNKAPLFNREKSLDSSGSERNSTTGSKQKPKPKARDSREKVNTSGKLGAVGETVVGSTGIRKKVPPEELKSLNGDIGHVQGDEDYVHVPDPNFKQRPAFQHVKIETTLPPPRVNMRVPVGTDPKSLHREMLPFSSLGVCESRRQMGAESHFPQSLCIETATHKPGALSKDMCPMCNLIFEANIDVDKRRSHINSHFKD